ncbi:hypothetical protein JVY00_17700 [Tsukamurella tyrosinosolvens]|uniref:hypothetical protein n=1 Tax=Tsukamurella tyrosinosolvens TaxID=57704 RepID=UPI001AF41A7D|nr:hypothetical protein [Tsukamurella tyrosinosolvens]QRY83668.1 hypothetical protein JVY00_17700 [Tsukamurella tyrosinosolvens]
MDEVLADTQLRVYVRDLTSGEPSPTRPRSGSPSTPRGINAAIEMWQASLGGTIAITGTPEQGRVTVNDADRVIILDSQWWTVTVDAAGSPVALPQRRSPCPYPLCLASSSLPRPPTPSRSPGSSRRSSRPSPPSGQ